MRLKNGDNNTIIEFDFSKGLITSLEYQGIQILAKSSEIFSVRLTDKQGNTVDYSSSQAKTVSVVEKQRSEVVYSDFSEDITVTLFITEEARGFSIRFAVKNATDKIVEHIETCPVILKPFIHNGGIGGK